MAVAIVAHTFLANASGLSTSNINIIGASLIVATITDYTGQSAAVLTDNAGNSWTPLTRYLVSGSTVAQRLWYCANPITSASYHVNIDATNTFVVVCVAAFSGVQLTTPKDQGVIGNTNSTTTIQPGSIMPTLSGELIICGVGSSGASNTIDSGFTQIDNGFYSPFFNASLNYLVQSSAAPINPTVTVGSGIDTAVSQASFFAASSGGSAAAWSQRLNRNSSGGRIS